MKECDRIARLRELCKLMVKERARFRHYLELEERVGFFDMSICKRAIREHDRLDAQINTTLTPEIILGECEHLPVFAADAINKLKTGGY